MRQWVTIVNMATLLYAALLGATEARAQDEVTDEAGEFDEYDDKDFESDFREFLGWYMVPNPAFPDQLAKLRYFGGIPPTETNAIIVLRKASGSRASLPSAATKIKDDSEEWGDDQDSETRSGDGGADQSGEEADPSESQQENQKRPPRGQATKKKRKKTEK